MASRLSRLTRLGVVVGAVLFAMLPASHAQERASPVWYRLIPPYSWESPEPRRDAPLVEWRVYRAYDSGAQCHEAVRDDFRLRSGTLVFWYGKVESARAEMRAATARGADRLDMIVLEFQLSNAYLLHAQLRAELLNSTCLPTEALPPGMLPLSGGRSQLGPTAPLSFPLGP